MSGKKSWTQVQDAERKSWISSHKKICLDITSSAKWLQRQTNLTDLRLSLSTRLSLMILCIRNTEVIERETAQGVSYPFPPPWGQTVFRPCLSSLRLHFVVLFLGPKWDAVQYNTLGIFAFATTNHQTPTSFIIINRSKTQKEGQSCIIKHTHSVRICACVC